MKTNLTLTTSQLEAAVLASLQADGEPVTGLSLAKITKQKGANPAIVSATFELEVGVVANARPTQRRTREAAEA